MNTISNGKSFFDMEMEFADACEIYQGKVAKFDGKQQTDALTIAFNLVGEKMEQELSESLKRYKQSPSLENKVEFADAIAKSIYDLCQLARTAGIPLNEVYAEVHRSNMMKVMADGKVHRRADGKILKPDGWTPPDIWGVLKIAADAEAIRNQSGGAENWGTK